MSITHHKVVVTPDDGTSEVGSDEWNAAHDVNLNLDDLADVNAPTPTDGYALTWVNASSAWQPAGVQPLDATLTALAATNWAANAVPIGSGADTLSQVSFAANKFPARASSGNLVAKDITDFGLSLVDDADASTARTTLGLVIGTDVQAYDAELAALAGLTSAADKLPFFTGSGTAGLADLTTAGRALIDDASASAQRTTLGLGTIATQDAPAQLWVGPFDPRINQDEVGAVANRAYYYAFTVDAPTTVTKAQLRVGGTSSGNLDMGIYSAAGTRLASTGSQASPGTYTYLTPNLSGSVALTPGTKYYAAVAADNASVVICSFFSYGGHRPDTILYGYQDSAFPLPSSFSLTAGAVKPFVVEFL